MAGLVNYVVDSEKESEDEKQSNTKARESKKSSQDARNRLSPVRKSSTCTRESNDSVKSKSREVPDSSSSKESRNREREHRHKHRKRSRSRDREKDKRRERSKDRDRANHRRKRSRSRSKDRRHKHKDDRNRRRSESKSRSKSPSRDKHNKSNRREREKEEQSDATNIEQPVTTTPSEQPADQCSQQSTSVPSFYNPNAVNQSRIAQQMQKRKLLWSNKEKETTTAKLWESTAFSQDQDGKMTAKFKRLMGIKSEAASTPAEPSDVLKKQKELFASLDQQYAVARATTHTQRGLGLGFSSNPR